MENEVITTIIAPSGPSEAGVSGKGQRAHHPGIRSSDRGPHNNKREEDKYAAMIASDPVREILASTPPLQPCLDLTHHIHRLNQVQVAQVADNATHVTELAIRSWCPVNLIQLRTLGLRLGQRLLEVDLSGSELLDSDLEAFVILLPVIRHFRFRNSTASLTSKAIRPLVQACHTTLTNLDLSGCKGIGSEALQWLGGALTHKSAHASRLLSLDVSDCPLLDDQGLIGLGKGCHALRYLNCSGCLRISDAGFEGLLRRLPQLRVLRLEGCININDHTLMMLGRHCSSLRSLNVGRCGSIGDRGLAAVGRGCRMLQALNLAGATRVTEGGLCALAQGCPGLQMLVLTGCEKVTMNGLRALIEGLKYVKQASTFTGFLPKDKAMLAKLDDVSYSLQETAAMRLQNGLMKGYNRRWGRRLLFEMRLAAAAAVIQIAFRKYVRRKMCWAGSYEIRRARCAIQIQRLYRGFLVRRLALSELRLKRNFRRFIAQAIIIQTAYRGYYIRQREGKLVVRAINDLVAAREREVNSAAVVYIQARARSRLSRRRLWAMAEVQAQRFRDQTVSAILLQCAYRCYRARVLLAQLQLEKMVNDRRMMRAARLIQRQWAEYKLVKARREEERRLATLREKQRRVATAIQAMYRGRRTRKAIREMLAKQNIDKKGATVLQKMYRSTRVMPWQYIRLNKIATAVWDQEDIEHENAVRRVQELRPRLLAALRADARSSDSEDDDVEGGVDPASGGGGRVEEDQQIWEGRWDEDQRVTYWYNPLTNECRYQLPVSGHTFQLALVGRQIKVYWPVEGKWFNGTIARYNRSKRKHKVEYEDGDTEWIDLRAEQDRIQVQEEESWVMLAMFEPSDVRELRVCKRDRVAREQALKRKKKEIAEWIELKDDEVEVSTASSQAAVIDETETATAGPEMVVLQQQQQQQQQQPRPKKRIRMINTRTGEARFKAVILDGQPDDWEPLLDPDGVVAFYSRSRGLYKYGEDPRMEPTGQHSAAEREAKREEILQDVYHASYVVQALLEEYAAIASPISSRKASGTGIRDRELNAFFLRFEKIPAVRRLAAALATAKTLLGEQEVAKDSYIAYANDLVLRAKGLLTEKQRLQERLQKARRRLLEVEKGEQTIACSNCAHQVPRVARFCPVCGAKVVVKVARSLYSSSASSSSAISQGSGEVVDTCYGDQGGGGRGAQVDEMGDGGGGNEGGGGVAGDSVELSASTETKTTVSASSLMVTG